MTEDFVKVSKRQKEQIIKEVLTTSTSIVEIAERHNIPAARLYNWVSRYRKENPGDQRAYSRRGKERMTTLTTIEASHEVVREPEVSRQSYDQLVTEVSQLRKLLQQALYERDCLKTTLEIVVRDGGHSLESMSTR